MVDRKMTNEDENEGTVENSPEESTQNLQNIPDLNEESGSDHEQLEKETENQNSENNESKQEEASKKDDKQLAIPRKGYFYEHDDRLGDKEELEKAK
jgi:hypothetical protein